MSDTVDALAEHFRANARKTDRDARFPSENLDELRASGLLGLLVPKRYGGAEASLETFVEAAGRLASGCLSTAMIWAMHCQQVDILARHASDALASRVLPKVAGGELYLASVTTERNSGGALNRAHSPLTDGNGALEFSRDAPVVTGGMQADGFLITLRSSAGSGAHQVSLVYADRSDLTIAETGSWDSLGMRGTHSVGLRLDGRVDSESLIGKPGRFDLIASDSMSPLGNLGWSACWIGAAQSRFSEVITWLRNPGRHGGPDVRSPLVAERLARIRVDLELAHAYLRRNVEEVSAARAAGTGSEPAARIHLNLLKLSASELTFRAVDRMIDLTGLAMGYLADAPIPLERSFRDLRSAALNYSNERILVETGSLVLMDRSVRLL